MRSAKLITPKIINTLCERRLAFLVLFSFTFCGLKAQDNSPYSRYGTGDLVPPTNIISRAMGGITAGYTDFLSINFNNPASYSSFQVQKEAKTKKIATGRAILDIGLNFETRTLKEAPPAQKFAASNALFSYMQVGVPLRSNWGFCFGLRPVSRISYKIIRNERLFDPLTHLPIDSASTRYEGEGGTYMATIGTGFSIFRKLHADKGEEKLSIGMNGGYFFGKKDYSTKRGLINDTVNYYQANYETKTVFGNLYFNAGIQYKVPLNKKIMLTVGAYGSWNQKLNATKDITQETFVVDAAQGVLRLDSVSEQRDIKGKIIYPGSYTVGFVAEKVPRDRKEMGWMVGLDFMQQKWDQYRYYGQVDSVKNKWEVRLGGQFRPVPKKNYFSNVIYRAGFFMGPDYIKVKGKLNQFGMSFGCGLPIFNARNSYASANQATLINLALEYGKRGNSNNLLRENMFRFSIGFSLSDLWFFKKKYD